MANLLQISLTSHCSFSTNPALSFTKKSSIPTPCHHLRANPSSSNNRFSLLSSISCNSERFEGTATLSEVAKPSKKATESDLIPLNKQALVPVEEKSSSSSSSGVLEVDIVTESDLKENGFRSSRRTKLVCTIGPSCCLPEQLEALAVGGMNVARLNMCHGSREWHAQVISHVRRLNEEKGYCIAIMIDTEGSEIHMGDLGGASSVRTEVLFSAFLGTFMLKIVNAMCTCHCG